MKVFEEEITLFFLALQAFDGYGLGKWQQLLNHVLKHNRPTRSDGTYSIVFLSMPWSGNLYVQ